MVTNESIGILVKPDAHARNLYGTLIKEFSELGYKVILEKEITLSLDDIEYLYPESFKIPAGRKSLCDYLENKKVTVVLFDTKKTSPIEEEIEKLHLIKGKKDKKFGLRYKYNETPISDKEIMEKVGNYYKYMTVNLFHVFDNQEQINYFIKKV